MRGVRSRLAARPVGGFILVAHATVNAPVFFWEQAGAIAAALLLLRWRWWNGDERVRARSES